MQSASIAHPFEHEPRTAPWQVSEAPQSDGVAHATGGPETHVWVVVSQGPLEQSRLRLHPQKPLPRQMPPLQSLLRAQGCGAHVPGAPPLHA